MFPIVYNCIMLLPVTIQYLNCHRFVKPVHIADSKWKITSRLTSRRIILIEINALTESTVLNSGKQPLAPVRASDLSSNCGRLERLEEWDPKVLDAHYRRTWMN